jgi:PAS domain S-box-containing protein
VSTAERLIQDKPEILRRWEAAVRAALPAARREERPVLLDSIPDFLDELAQALTEQGATGSDVCRTPREHARQRAQETDYSLEQVVREYSLLRQALLDVLDASGPVGRGDLKIILDTIDLGVNEAATHFAELQARALRETEERFRLLVASVKDYAIFMLDPEGHIVSWNLGAERIEGYSAEEVLGKHFSIFYTEEDRRRGKPERILHTAALEERYEEEGWRVRKDGSSFQAHELISAIRDPAGALRGFAKVARDVTESRASEERFRSVVDTVLDGIITIDEHAAIQTFNPAAERIFGYSIEEVLGKNVKLLMPEPYRSEHDGYVQNYRQSGVPKIIGTGREVTGLRKDGSTFPLDLAVSEFHAGPRRFFTGVVRDISERKRLEAELRERAEALAEANRRKDELLAMLGHELRNPLSPIRSAVEIMRLRGSDDPEVQRCRDVIDRQVAHLTRLVDDLLDVARVTRGKLRLRREPVELERLVEQAVETVRLFIEEHRHRLSVKVEGGPIWLDADPTRISQVVANLLHNAAKFTEPEGRIELDVRTEGAEAVIRVRDTGAGIPPELLPHVFDLFTQGSRTMDRTQGGLGIGLTLVHRLVELHGGSVRVHSDGVGTGSEFVIRLPTVAAAEVPDTGQSEPAAKQAPRPMQILVVDDNIDAASTLAQVLQLWGHSARAAYGGREALEVALAQRPGVILLDIGLPDIDGYEVARRLRGQPDLNGVCLIALTGYGQERDKQLAQEAGFNGHLTKPVDLAALQRLIAACP